jgi:hypothetical protein
MPDLVQMGCRHGRNNPGEELGPDDRSGKIGTMRMKVAVCLSSTPIATTMTRSQRTMLPASTALPAIEEIGCGMDAS